jgi:adenylate cyclase
MTKTLNCTVVVSEEVCNKAGVASDRLERTDIPIRGRDQPLTVYTVADPTLLATLLDEKAASLTAERISAQMLV